MQFGLVLAIDDADQNKIERELVVTSGMSVRADIFLSEQIT